MFRDDFVLDEQKVDKDRTLIQFYPNLSNFIQFNSIWSNFIQFDPILTNFLTQFSECFTCVACGKDLWIQIYPIIFNLSNCIQFYPILFNFIQLYSIWSNSIQFDPILTNHLTQFSEFFTCAACGKDLPIQFYQNLFNFIQFNPVWSNLNQFSYSIFKMLHLCSMW